MIFIQKPEYHPYVTEWIGQLYNLASRASSYGSNYPRKFGGHPFQLPEQTKEYKLLGSGGKWHPFHPIFLENKVWREYSIEVVI